jgi:hypothetical protein
VTVSVEILTLDIRCCSHQKLVLFKSSELRKLPKFDKSHIPANPAINEDTHVFQPITAGVKNRLLNFEGKYSSKRTES